MARRNDAELASEKRGYRNLRALRARYQLFPLDFFLEELNDFRRPPEFRRDMARAAAAYLHPRLMPVFIIQAAGESETAFDLKKLSDREVDQLELIIGKCQIPAADVAEEE